MAGALRLGILKSVQAGTIGHAEGRRQPLVALSTVSVRAAVNSSGVFLLLSIASTVYPPPFRGTGDTTVANTARPACPPSLGFINTIRLQSGTPIAGLQFSKIR